MGFGSPDHCHPRPASGALPRLVYLSMKNPARPLVRVSLLTVVGGIAFTGCQTTKSPALNQGASAAASSQSAADAISAARSQVGVTTAALRNLVDRPQDIPAQYKVALAQLSKLKSDSLKISDAAAAMRIKGDAYLADWARQVSTITDPVLRDAAFARRAEISARLQTLYKSYQTAKAAYAPYLASLADIQTVLGTDLSAKGLESVKPFVAKVSAEADPLRAALDQLSADYSAVSFALQPGGS